MFDFDVVTGPTQPPHCPIAEDSAVSGAAESSPRPAGLATTAGNTRAESLSSNGEKPRS
ncbi:hypothetical protein SAMN02982917_0037 [Azospirillum oryzae]|uniref:Uncharacterized protein n=1 Tax=Azospirillum oryzae TaxID=286727 RepID=A0A1X7HR98_9PROT|nr:hypothetical protein SAMN02982917_0037 [Azospirillum oryzae]